MTDHDQIDNLCNAVENKLNRGKKDCDHCEGSGAEPDFVGVPCTECKGAGLEPEKK